ncbi:expressed unknown protein [Seminavis robusta]|uniref:Uncharacterized protein n=1 Tax=Seminavis robusta TaxID=568900 RepID=A0A9N8HXN5_9STRA|nr:expressed unknown protein [Seminavis robusta]|eukprot:Sro2556_g331151.1  (272) ;mRNA; r:5105-5920
MHRSINSPMMKDNDGSADPSTSTSTSTPREHVHGYKKLVDYSSRRAATTTSGTHASTFTGSTRPSRRRGSMGTSTTCTGTGTGTGTCINSSIPEPVASGKLQDSISTFGTMHTGTGTTGTTWTWSRSTINRSTQAVNFNHGSGHSRSKEGERRSKMNWLANNTPKRSLHNSYYAAACPKRACAPPVVLKVIFPKGKEPVQAQCHALNGNTDDNDDDNNTAVDVDNVDVDIDISISLRTLTGQKPKLAACTRRRSSTSFVAGSQIKTYSLVY